MHDIWRELGIDPTDDVIAVKRAYAKRLKLTRPDDDAAAYQCLREAYDAALDWARHQARHAPAPVTMPDGEGLEAERRTPSLEPEDRIVTPRQGTPDFEIRLPVDELFAKFGSDVSPQIRVSDWDTSPLPASDDGFGEAPVPALSQAPMLQASESVESLPEFHSPEDIASAIHGAWRESGDDVLLALWPRIHRDLEALPLEQRDQASAWLAALVLDNPRMPADFITVLARHFGWVDDFRSLVELDGQRATVLCLRLRELGLGTTLDPALQHRFREVRTLAALLRQGRKWRALALAVLLPGAVFQKWHGLTPDGRTRLDLTAAECHRIDGLKKVHWAAALAGCCVLFFVLTLGLRGDPLLASFHALFALGMAILTLLYGLLYVTVLGLVNRCVPNACERWREAHPRLAPRVLAGMSLTWLIWSAFLPANVDDLGPAQFLIGWGVVILLPLIDGLEGLAWRALLLPVAIALGIVIEGIWPGASGLFIFTLAQAWVLAASLLLKYRTAWVVSIYRNPFVWLQPRTSRNGGLQRVRMLLAFPVLVLLSIPAWPLGLFVSTLRHGLAAGFVTLACAGVLGAGLAADGGDSVVAWLFSGVAALWLMAGLRWVSGKLADRLLP